MRPDLDRWLPEPGLRVYHRRESTASPERLWDAARGVTLRDARLLGRLVRWRLPGTPAHITFDELFRRQPFLVLQEGEEFTVSGLVGRIWTLRRDYPPLGDAGEFEAFSQRGSARVVFAHWVEPAGGSRSALVSEARVEAIGMQGRLGVRAIRPLVSRFQGLIGNDGIGAAVRRAEQGPGLRSD